MTADIANWEIFVWSLSQLGGGDDSVDVEEAFIRSFEIAPERFGWRTRPDLPDYKKTSKALRDAEARRPLLFVKSGDGLRRQLSVEGSEWVERSRSRLGEVLGGGAPVAEPKRRPRARLIREAETNHAFLAWQESGALPTEQWRIADLLRCSPDSAPSIWVQRLEVLRQAAHSTGASGLLRFLDTVRKANPAWFGEER